MKLFSLIAAIFLAGCASTTGVVPAGKDQFLIAREDNGPTSSLADIKAKVFKEAGAFCASQGKTMQVVRENDVPRAFMQFPQTSLQFTCV